MSNSTQQHETALSAWKDGKVKQSISTSCARCPPKAVPISSRPRTAWAVFDNDGTLWCEQPLPVQGEFALERVKQVADERPALREKQPFKSILEHDRAAMSEFGQARGLSSSWAATHTGIPRPSSS